MLTGKSNTIGYSFGVIHIFIQISLATICKHETTKNAVPDV